MWGKRFPYASSELAYVKSKIRMESDEVTSKENMIIKVESRRVFYSLRAQTVDLPEKSLGEINAEIDATRKKRWESRIRVKKEQNNETNSN